MQPTLLFGVKSNRVGGRDWNLPLRRRQAGSHTRRDGRLRQGKDELIPSKVGLVKGQGLVFSTNAQARFLKSCLECFFFGNWEKQVFQKSALVRMAGRGLVDKL